MAIFLRDLLPGVFSLWPRGRRSRGLPLASGSCPVGGHGLGPRPAENASWTVLVYLDGDNSLDSEGVFNVNQMEQVNYPADGSSGRRPVRPGFQRLLDGHPPRRIVHDTNTTTIPPSPARTIRASARRTWAIRTR